METCQALLHYIHKHDYEILQNLGSHPSSHASTTHSDMLGHCKAPNKL